MSENMTKAMPPVPMPDAAGPQGSVAPKAKRPKWLIPAIAASCVVVLAAGGFGGYAAWNGHELAQAKAACAEAADAARVAANDYAALVDGKAADASKIKTADVKDAKTVDALAKALKAEAPKYEGCVADGKTGLDAAAAKLGGQADWYKAHGKSLSKAVAAVESSKLDKTVDTANALLKSSDGKVADGKTRDELAKAIKARDADAIGKATAAVNASVKAKSDADAQAQQATADTGSQAATGGQSYANTGYTGGGYTGGGYANTGYTGSGYSGDGYSYTGGSNGGGYTAPSTPSGGNGGSSAGNAGTSNGGSQWGGGCSVTVNGGSSDACSGDWDPWS